MSIDFNTPTVVAANISYQGFTYNTLLKIHWKHTGQYYFLRTKKGIHILSGLESAQEQKAKSKKVYVSSGYWFIKRLSIEVPTAEGQITDWFINNTGDVYSINKVSKYAKKVYAEAIKEDIKIFNTGFFLTII